MLGLTEHNSTSRRKGNVAPTPTAILRGLRAIEMTQAQAATLTGRSRAMVSLVLHGKAKSRPLLNDFAELIRLRQSGMELEMIRRRFVRPIGDGRDGES